jgi:hypothetical protein
MHVEPSRMLPDDDTPPSGVSHFAETVVGRQLSGERMHELHHDVERLRRQVITELAELPLAPWRPQASRRKRYSDAARRSFAGVLRAARVKA